MSGEKDLGIKLMNKVPSDFYQSGSFGISDSWFSRSLTTNWFCKKH